MLSFAGLPADAVANGVGDGSGRATWSSREARADFLVVPAEAATANAKLFRDKPATHARAQVLTAIFLKCLGIIPSSGTSRTSVTCSLGMPTFQAQPHYAEFWPVVKRERSGALVSFTEVAVSCGF